MSFKMLLPDALQLPTTVFFFLLFFFGAAEKYRHSTAKNQQTYRIFSTLCF